MRCVIVYSVLHDSGVVSSLVAQLRKGMVEICILNLLNKGESYGYEIVQTLKGIELLAVTESTVYPVLSRLRNDGYVKVRTGRSDDGPPRRYFSLTKLGMRRLKEVNEYWDDLQEAVKTLQAGKKEK
jgi:PadR family transcriptional regulator PadR